MVLLCSLLELAERVFVSFTAVKSAKLCLYSL
jgi:hypothetical protein